MKCKFCDNHIEAGYRCIDCFIKKVDKLPEKVVNPYIDAGDLTFDENLKVRPDDTYNPWLTTDTTAGSAGTLPTSFQVQPARLPTYAGAYNPWFRDTWGPTGQGTLATSNSTTMGFRTRAFTKNR